MSKKKLIILVFVVVAIICCIKICIKKEYYKIIDRTGNVINMKENNDEVLGWLMVQGTDIDYPIINQTAVDKDPDYDYLWKNTSDESIEEKVTIVGHNIRNVSKKPIVTKKGHTRFEQLMSFIYYDFAKNNEYIQYTVGKENYLYKIYAVTFSNKNQEDEHLKLETYKEKKC